LPIGFKVTIGIAIMLMVGAYFPAMIYVYLLGGDVVLAGNLQSLAYVAGIYTAILAAWLPTSGISDRPRRERFEKMVTVWLWVVYTMAIIWELPWVLFWETFAKAPAGTWWVFPWLAYVSGDIRYATGDSTIWTFELFTVFNGFIGAAALVAWYRSGRTSIKALVAFLVTASSHLYQTAIYYVVDWLEGFSNVGDDAIFDLLLKFVLINSPFILMPICVILWAAMKLSELNSTTRRG
jgi:hypothetical protein